MRSYWAVLGIPQKHMFPPNSPLSGRFAPIWHRLCLEEAPQAGLNIATNSAGRSPAQESGTGAARETKDLWTAKMKMADFIIGALVGAVAFLALIAHLGTAWSVVISLFAGASALLLSNAFRMTQGIR